MRTVARRLMSKSASTNVLFIYLFPTMLWCMVVFDIRQYNEKTLEFIEIFMLMIERYYW
jgi:hypothetical protein